QALNRQYPPTSQEQTLLDRISEQSAVTIDLSQQVIDARDADDYERAQTIMLQQAGPAYSEWLSRVNQFIDLQEQINNVTTNDAR
ncbi:MCP four helix bundle domain-containing protein, partial [Tritonibacter sp. SIMBA_163]|uniref:MCP four helix bundle domain-containing protein n=1 Tax=Tritonibacter sp. SIMBA_163 TaxID=3080868 RepID=UPI00397EF053